MNIAKFPIEPTNKELSFLSDPELEQIIINILFEIDNLVIINAYRSMLYLSMSTLEGILSNVLLLNENKIKAFPSYPKDKKGQHKKREDLDLRDKIFLANKLGIIKDDYLDVSDKFRLFRNYMHPERELKEKEPLDLGLGQIALGLMNHIIIEMGKIRFIDEKIWHVLSGKPSYNSIQAKIDFIVYRIRTNSFIITDDYKGIDIEITFELHIGKHAVFNLVYNYEDEDTFNMLRFDTRINERSGILECKRKYAWKLVKEYDWEIKKDELNRVKVVLCQKNLTAFLNDNELIRDIPCDLNKCIGFFNEVDNVSITNLEIKSI
jgi:hypothetical protein